MCRRSFTSSTQYANWTVQTRGHSTITTPTRCITFLVPERRFEYMRPLTQKIYRIQCQMRNEAPLFRNRTLCKSNRMTETIYLGTKEHNLYRGKSVYFSLVGWVWGSSFSLLFSSRQLPPRTILYVMSWRNKTMFRSRVIFLQIGPCGGQLSRCFESDSTQSESTQQQDRNATGDHNPLRTCFSTVNNPKSPLALTSHNTILSIYLYYVVPQPEVHILSFSTASGSR